MFAAHLSGLLLGFMLGTIFGIGMSAGVVWLIANLVRWSYSDEPSVGDLPYMRFMQRLREREDATKCRWKND